MWTKLSDDFFEDERRMEATVAQKLFDIGARVYCAKRLTDGVVSEGAIKLISAWTGVDGKRAVNGLLDVGLWDVHKDGYKIVDFLERNWDAETVKKRQSDKRQDEPDGDAA